METASRFDDPVCRYAPTQPANYETMTSGSGVVSANPRSGINLAVREPTNTGAFSYLQPHFC